ncbi:hypothetical protein BH760_gp55 [Gordonia phage Splinter]|uniref:Uncharacterized protein n=2 Tax=Vendettavirus vendetta TaxID=2049886 RepID=A0A166Y472_9CAUD|nr:hypothetical protein BH795_gp55 [Gordonia phage Vendetta]YP_009275410.1 hypothetical protein BH760_gp55 [Gordonia phage Splinter]ANA85603.1 hypothetical protein PBI_VENDETTA_56 [Gordonia phage Vendetta]ANA85682.1 hypothetical protein PBI_SPLINTER_56 [Gordonia phage Splinter]
MLPMSTIPTHEVRVEVVLADEVTNGFRRKGEKFGATFRLPADYGPAWTDRERVEAIERGIEQVTRSIGDRVREHYGVASRRAQAKVDAHYRRRAIQGRIEALRNG